MVRLETWRRVLRKGILLGVGAPALTALMNALDNDDPRIIQGATTDPLPLIAVESWDCKGACALGFIAMAEGKRSVGEVELRFAKLCQDGDFFLGSTMTAGTAVGGEVRPFLNWFDITPRAEMRRELAAEVKLELDRRNKSRVA